MYDIGRLPRQGALGKTGDLLKRLRALREPFFLQTAMKENTRGFEFLRYETYVYGFNEDELKEFCYLFDFKDVWTKYGSMFEGKHKLQRLYFFASHFVKLKNTKEREENEFRPLYVKYLESKGLGEII